MPRAATSSDVFNAVAEPARRAILDSLTAGERPVGALVAATRQAQPSVSKHLRVLRDVGLVTTRRDGRRRFYRLNADALRPLRDWVRRFDAYLDRQLDRVQERAESKQREQERAESEQRKPVRRPPSSGPARGEPGSTS